ncbi:MAG TPA: iron-sulfur cluster assembly protein [Candidatus Thalassarchaeaceae archaeon]|jgi:metal-sulfur cluster biosynthetic enzyme|nr:iron-sulfur cluster assembly protein [Candidatus Thalassarchaeaceae archaeon]HJL65039.1 iron-sulfur cluster assembly protein [Candidatus Thalassarchaeaceae archaeon]HJO42380.1 iron-sulfur cluster assembly protein [Candidatus Thalassarchaeaceae archaeon]|tara:strand:+ start:731 stop:1033 length:303 start_codon:yes stop_codon:yes gene_type:complete
MVDESTIRASLTEVEDPEMKISVIDLGLIYDVRIDESHAEIDMTLTSPGCPVAAELMAAVHRAALTTEGVDSVHVNLTFSPLWDPKIHATEDGKFELGIF